MGANFQDLHGMKCHILMRVACFSSSMLKSNLFFHRGPTYRLRFSVHHSHRIFTSRLVKSGGTNGSMTNVRVSRIRLHSSRKVSLGRVEKRPMVQYRCCVHCRLW